MAVQAAQALRVVMAVQALQVVMVLPRIRFHGLLLRFDWVTMP